jgi:23S rRNA (uracil1939-C5)-methyltransferase
MSAATAAHRPTCRHFGTCGSCDRLDQPYPQQLLQRRDAVAKVLQEVLGDVELEYELPPSTPLQSRIKLSWPIAVDAAGRATLGMYARGSHELVPITECRLQDSALTRLAARAQQLFRELRLPVAQREAAEGALRAFHARILPGTRELLLGVTTRGGRFPAGPQLAQGLNESARGLRDRRGRPLQCVGVVRSLRDEADNTLLGDRHVPLLGREYQFAELAGQRLRVSFGSFWQNHAEAERILYRKAMELLADVRGLRVIDGYGGVGAFARLLAAAGAREVTVVESSRTAVADARHNAALPPANVVHVESAPFANSAQSGPVDLVIVDPPRKGLEAAGVARLLAWRPTRILYVACSAQAQARDLQPVLAAGYRPRRAAMVDLFPHTAHAETLILLDSSRGPSRDDP